eukprot:4687082-Pyramimonas_sp.AAC.1
MGSAVVASRGSGRSMTAARWVRHARGRGGGREQESRWHTCWSSITCLRRIPWALLIQLFTVMDPKGPRV